MLTGSYRHPLDAKGRCVVPKVFRSQMGEVVYLTRGIDKCIWVFPEDAWRSFAAEIQRRAAHHPDGSLLLRYFLGTAFEVSFDRMGRVQIPAALRDWAELGGETVIVGLGERVEIWPAKGWDASMAEMTPDRIRDAMRT